MRASEKRAGDPTEWLAKLPQTEAVEE